MAYNGGYNLTALFFNRNFTINKLSMHIIMAILILCCFDEALSVPISNANQPAPQDDINNSYRLPGDIEPLKYDITLKPYLLESDKEKRFTFDGDVFIEFKVKTPTRNIRLHAKNLNVTTCTLTNADTNTIDALPPANPDPKSDIVTYTAKNDLNVNNTYVLRFVYKGVMEDDMHGFYRSSYKDDRNVTKWLASTQFETNHARRAFPCFDEPKYKARFNITLNRHKSMKTVSNTRIRTSTLEAGEYYVDVYEETPAMSTYVVAFIVSEFNERFDGVFGIIARPEFYPQTEYGFHIGQKILKQLDDYLQKPYFDMGIQKMEMAAIPDFSAGAMENWGLVTYRERALLYEEGSTSLSAKQRIASIIAHEEAHMWFGNLVTCDWWSYTWLNEGFARYFQYFATAEVEKDFHVDKQFVVEEVYTVMEKDSTNDTNPLTDPNTNTHSDLTRMFNTISYNKGAAFIRMVKFAMGEDNFCKSLKEYLDKYEFKNTVPQNLFEIWKKYFPKELQQYVDQLFVSFTTQVGYPVITFKVTSSQTMEISQKRFLLNPEDGSDPNLLYTVPITFTTDVEKNFETTQPTVYITPDTKIIQHRFPKNISWIVANIQSSGYYRVNYDEKTWHKIHRALFEDKWGGIHEQNRAQIIEDLLNLARASEINYGLAFDILEYLSTETEYLPWSAAFDGFRYLSIRLGVDTNNFGLYIRQLSDKAYGLLGFEEKVNDTSLDIYNRAKVLAWSCKYGNPDCITRAKEYFNKNLNIEPVPVNIRSVVYCTALREGSEKDFEKLYNKYTAETGATEKTLILSTLGCVKDRSLVTKLFNIILSNVVRSQDKADALSKLYSENNENVELVFDLILGDLEHFANAMGGYPSVANVIAKIASRFTEVSQQKKLKDFNEANKDKFGSSASTLQLAEKIVADNLLWSSSKLGDIKSYLEKSNLSSSAPHVTVTILLMCFSTIVNIF